MKKLDIYIYDRTHRKSSIVEIIENLKASFVALNYAVSCTSKDINCIVRILNETEYKPNPDRHQFGVVISDSEILNDRFSYQNANKVWNINGPDIKAVIVDDYKKSFETNNIYFQFAPLCLIHIPTRQNYSSLVSYLTNNIAPL
ncbi:hypothetical protein ACTHO0_19175 [Cytobacillus praedii]|uniref:hypothetical protein n=1 Tax=Cytobacillus praedii TaxID=1742358 RepID=UPI003F7F3001